MDNFLLSCLSKAAPERKPIEQVKTESPHLELCLRDAKRDTTRPKLGSSGCAMPNASVQHHWHWDWCSKTSSREAGMGKPVHAWFMRVLWRSHHPKQHWWDWSRPHRAVFEKLQQHLYFTHNRQYKKVYYIRAVLFTIYYIASSQCKKSIHYSSTLF